MLINAQPRAVLGFRAFTPQHRTLRPQGLFEMENNDLNALTFQHADLAGLSNEDWKDSFEGLEQENFFNPFATPAYNDPYEALSYYQRTQSAHSAPRAFPTHPAVRRPQTLYTRKLAPQSSDFQTSQPVDYWRSTVMLSQTTHDWRRIGYSNVPDLSRQYENFSSPFSPQVTRQPSFDVDFAYQPSSTLSFNSGDTQDGLDEDRWCSNPKEDDLSNRTHDLSFSSYDGMSSAFGTFELTPPMRWQEDTAPGGTISPKVLSLSSLFPSSGASPCHVLDLEKSSEMHDELSLHCHDDNLSHYHGPKDPAEPETQDSSTRHKLPSKPLRPQYVPILPSTDAKGTKKRASMTRQTTASSPTPRASSPTPPATSKAKHAAPPRTDPKDEFLIASKLAGMSYREIRRAGGFKEAESTLRGRYRTLTKSKEERVRKPEWLEGDVRLLRKAVGKFGRVGERRGTEAGKARIPWKKVAEYIVEHGGSYRFGNATCRKRWDELVESGEAR